MISLDIPPTISLPNYYRASKPAIIRPGVDIASYFPVEIDRATRRVIIKELLKRGIVDDKAKINWYLEQAAIPFGMFKPTASSLMSFVGFGVTTSGTTISLPGGVALNDTIIILYGVGSGTLTVSGFTETANPNNPHILYKMAASGSEGTSVTIASGTVRGAISLVLRGINTSATVEEVAPAGTADPPSITPSWGTSKPTAFIAVGYRSGSSAASATYPTGYTDGQAFQSYNYTGTSYGTLAAGVKFATLASDDPSAFAFNSGSVTSARTLVLKSL